MDPSFPGRVWDVSTTAYFHTHCPAVSGCIDSNDSGSDFDLRDRGNCAAVHGKHFGANG